LLVSGYAHVFIVIVARRFGGKNIILEQCCQHWFMIVNFAVDMQSIYSWISWLTVHYSEYV